MNGLKRIISIIILAALLPAASGCALNDGEKASADVPAPSSAPNSHEDSAAPPNGGELRGSLSGLMYYSLALFGMDRSELNVEDPDESRLLDSFLMRMEYSVLELDYEAGLGTILMTAPDMDELIRETVSAAVGGKTNSDSEALLMMASAQLINAMDTAERMLSRVMRFPIERYGDGMVFAGAEGIGAYIDEFFFAPYEEYMNVGYISELLASVPFQLAGVESVDDIRAPIIELDGAYPDEESIYIASVPLTIADSGENGGCTEAISIDADGDGCREIIWILAEYGIVVFKSDDMYAAVNMPESWRSAWTLGAGVDCAFHGLVPDELIIIDSDTGDNRVEFIVRMRDAQREGVYGEYYVFGYDSGASLNSSLLLEYGETCPFLGLHCDGDQLALETFVNIMGFRYMRVSARLDEELKLEYGADGGCLLENTAGIVSDTDIAARAESRAELAMPLECYRLNPDGTRGDALTLPAGTVLTPIRAAGTLCPDGGGIEYAEPVRADAADYPAAEDYARLCRSGEIIFRDERGGVYAVHAEILPSRSVDLALVKGGEALSPGTYYYPESVYIGGIEQNLLFKELDYTAYFEYWGAKLR